MFRLIVNNIDLDLPPNFSVTRVMKNPLFFTDQFEGNVTYDVSISAKSKLNQKTLGFLDKPFVVNTAYQFSCIMMYKGFVLMQGSLVIKNSILNGEYKGYIKDESALLNNAISGISLNDFNYEELVDYNNKREIAYNPDTEKSCVFPITNANFFLNRLDRFSDEFLQVDAPTAKALHNKYNRNCINSSGLYTPASEYIEEVFRTAGGLVVSDTSFVVVWPYMQFPFLRWLIEYIFEEIGYKLTNNFFASSNQLKAICMYLNWDICNLQINYDGDTEGYFWYHKDATSTDQFTPDGTILSLQQKMPDMLLKDFLLSLCNYFNLYINVNDLAEVSLLQKNDILNSSTIDDWSSIKLSKINTKSFKSKFVLSWTNDDKDTLISYTNIDHYGINYKGEVAATINLPQPTFSSLDFIYYVQNVDGYYQCKQVTSKNIDDIDITSLQWIGISDSKSFQDIVINYDKDNEYNYVSKCFAFDIYSETNIIDTSSLSPAPTNAYEMVNVNMLMQGNRADFLENDNDMSLRFMLYHGIIDFEVETVEYSRQFGTCNSKDINGDLISGFDLNFSLQNIYEKYWTEWADFIANGKEISANVYLDESKLSALDLTKKKITNEGTFFIKQISTPISLQGIGISTIECKFL